MKNSVIISRSKPNYVSILVGLPMFYFGYDYLIDGTLVMAIIALAIALIGVVHNILLITTPLLVQEQDSLIVKPKIPFERKVILLDELVDAKALSDSVLMLVLENKQKIKLDMGGFKANEISKVRRYLQSLL